MLRIRDVYPGSRIRIFSHPGSQKTWGGKKNLFRSVFLPFCSFPLLLKQILTHNCCTEFIQFNNYFELFSFFNPRKYWLSEIMVGSGIRKKPIPDPGSRGQKGTGSRIRIRNTGFLICRCLVWNILPLLVSTAKIIGKFFNNSRIWQIGVRFSPILLCSL